jgi:hypothetical protein
MVERLSGKSTDVRLLQLKKAEQPISCSFLPKLKDDKFEHPLNIHSPIEERSSPITTFFNDLMSSNGDISPSKVMFLFRFTVSIGQS